MAESNGKRPRNEEQEWLTAYKSQCEKGKHKIVHMAEMLGIKEPTFRTKILRKGKIDIAFGGRENCQFCLKMKKDDISTPKRKVPIIRRKLITMNANSSPDNPSCVITEEMLEKVSTKCDNHTYDQMAKVLGVLGNSLNQRVIRAADDLVFTNEKNDSEKCYFCQCTDDCQSPGVKMTNEMLEKVASKCKKHSYDLIGKILGVNRVLG